MAAAKVGPFGPRRHANGAAPRELGPLLLPAAPPVGHALLRSTELSAGKFRASQGELRVASSREEEWARRKKEREREREKLPNEQWMSVVVVRVGVVCSRVRAIAETARPRGGEQRSGAPAADRKEANSITFQVSLALACPLARSLVRRSAFCATRTKARAQRAAGRPVGAHLSRSVA